MSRGATDPAAAKREARLHNATPLAKKDLEEYDELERLEDQIRSIPAPGRRGA